MEKIQTKPHENREGSLITQDMKLSERSDNAYVDQFLHQ